MKNKTTVFRVMLILLVIFLSVHLPAKNRWTFDLEAGPVFATSNFHAAKPGVLKTLIVMQ